MKESYLIYKFSKGGHTYTATGSNRWEARMSVELAHHVDLAGATYQVIRKSNVLYTGIEK